MVTIVSATEPRWLDEWHTAFDVQITLESGSPQPFTVVQSDGEELGQELWTRALAGDFGPIAAYGPPPDEPLAPLTARRLRLGLVLGGFSLDQVEAVIDAIEDPLARSIARIEWADASQYDRSHPLIAQVGSTLGLTNEQIDAMWTAALVL